MYREGGTKQAVDEKEQAAVVFFQAGSAAGASFFFFTFPAKLHDPCAEHVLPGPTDGTVEGFKEVSKAAIFVKSASLTVKAIIGPVDLRVNRRVQRRFGPDHDLFFTFPAFPFSFVLRSGPFLFFFPEFLQTFGQRLQFPVH